ncbi:MAG: N-acetyltransferase [Proteobacteria bacterium]|jgi:predicted N-acyltransferase|nr:N-acetyltransferase [Pseudomonadota bacterium]
MDAPLPLDTPARGALARLRIRDDVPLAAIAPAAWDSIAGTQPFVSHAWLSALEESGCATPLTGWTPRFLTAWRGDVLVGALPLYAKAHSYGEYVFDWGWANAYRHHGRRYYPKLVAAVPFTPVTGPRMLAGDRAVRDALLAAARAGLAHGYSSLHMLFADGEQAAEGAASGMMLRSGVQFHWSNGGYRDFTDFLFALNHAKRSKIRQERQRVAAAGIEFRRLDGDAIRASDWAFFHDCYTRTYAAHGSTPYLTREFFERIASGLSRNVLLVVGYRGSHPLCAALDIHDGRTLWGRYWGTREFVPGLHFEACYYQAIEFCIERAIMRFEGGAQGAHKLARGLLPAPTRSLHAVADPAFAAAIAAFCAGERDEIMHAIDELEASSPFRRPAANDGATPPTRTDDDPTRR